MTEDRGGDLTGLEGTAAAGEGLRDGDNGLILRLEQEKALYDRLLELAREKRLVLLAGPAGEEQARSLERILLEEQTLLNRFNNIEEPAGGGYGGIPEGPGVHELRKRLHRTVQELKQLNRENGEILKRFQRYVEFTVGLLEKKTGGGTYRETGSGQGAVIKVSCNRSRISRQV